MFILYLTTVVILNNLTDMSEFLLPCFIDIPVVNAKSIDHDQTPRSDLGGGPTKMG